MEMNDEMTLEELLALKSLVEKIVREAIAPEIARQLEQTRNALLEKMNELASKQNPVYYTREEVCAKLDICKATFHNWVSSGNIRPVRIGGRVYVEPSELDRVIRAIGSGEIKLARHKKNNKE